MNNIEKNLTPKNSIPITHFKTKGGNMIVVTEEGKYDKEMKEFWKDKYFEMQDNYHNANEEIKRLNNEIKTLLKENANKEKLIIKQNNIIDELEKELNKGISMGICVCNKRSAKSLLSGAKYYQLFILDYLKELKGSDK